MAAFLDSAVQELSETHKKWLLCMWRNHPNIMYVAKPSNHPGGGEEERKKVNRIIWSFSKSRNILNSHKILKQTYFQYYLFVNLWYSPYVYFIGPSQVGSRPKGNQKMASSITWQRMVYFLIKNRKIYFFSFYCKMINKGKITALMHFVLKTFLQMLFFCFAIRKGYLVQSLVI